MSLEFLVPKQAFESSALMAAADQVNGMALRDNTYPWVWKEMEVLVNKRKCL
jgi:hypothetical protein